MLSWEFPPRIVGGLARHCYGLSRALSRNGVEVHVITLEFPGTPLEEIIDDVMVHRVKIEIGNPNFLTWVLLFNHFMEKRAGMLMHEVGDFDLIHAHDWLTALAGIALKHVMGCKLIFTIHSTEIGRSGGLYVPDSFTKDSIEWWGTYEAAYVIAVSEPLRDEIISHFKVPEWKVVAVPNGIDVTKFERDVNKEGVRAKYGVMPGELLILAVGRLTPQKGFQHLIYAMPQILRRHPKAKLLIVGDGWMRGELERAAYEVGCHERIRFTGFLSDDELIELYLSADLLVVPSIYEPFGITALEGMAAGLPVVASKVGGLQYIVEHERTGIWVIPGDPRSIAWGVDYVLSNPDRAKQMGENARRKVKNEYSWDIIAERTIGIYKKTLMG